MKPDASALAPLTGLRGVAAYSVLLAHALETFFVYQQGGPTPFHGTAFRLAYFGMSLFFVLSGFVLFYNYGHRFQGGIRPAARAVYHFFVARFARLYPLYAAGLIAAAPHDLPEVFHQHRWRVLLSYVTLTQSWINTEIAFFPPDWSISTEWFFYFAFVPAALLVRRLPRPLLCLVLYAAIAPLSVFALFRFQGAALEALVHEHIFIDAAVSSPSHWWMTYLAPPLRLLEFVAGMLTARAYLSLRDRPANGAAITPVLAASLTWCATLVFLAETTGIDTLLSEVLPNIAYAPALAALMLCLCLRRGWLHRALASPPLLFMGEISYSVYMWSFFVQRLLPPLPLRAGFTLIEALPAISDTIVDAVLTTALAYGSYRIIESPARRLIRRTLSAP
jgi:hypothetical protein